MKLDDLIEQWKSDSKIDVSNLTSEAINTVSLHNKYFPYYIKEGLKLKILKNEYKQLYLTLSEYYKGELDEESIKQLNLAPFNLRLLKSDVAQYVEANDKIITLSLKIGAQEYLVEFLESILKQINNRGFIIKNVIDFEKFKAGY